jgi:glycosyltransferase involved in cell wall biosynthesis
VARELTTRLAARGHRVEVVTTSLTAVDGPGTWHSRTEEHDGVRVHYLATPAHYRWMGITPTLPATLARAPRPDVVHVFGFRDAVTTATAAWCRIRGIPYVFEPLGMFTPRVRKLRLKRMLDPTLYRGVATGAAAVVVASERERNAVVAAGISASRVHVRGNGFPSPPPSTAGDGATRGGLGVPAGAPLVLYVGRVAAGKGLEHLAAAAEELPDAHVVVVGPDDRHGTAAVLGRSPRVHVLPPTEEPPFDLYRAADVFVLPSEGESFGLVAAEAAAVGTPVVVTDRCGIAGFFEEGEALVVPATRASVVDAIRRVLTDQDLAARLREGGTAAARRMSWDYVVDVQEQIYFEAAARTAATNASTLAS